MTRARAGFGGQPCSFSGCDRKIAGRGLCNAHLGQLLRGRPLGPIQVKCRPFAELFWEKVRRGDGCWEWIGTRVNDRYGQTTKKGRHVLAHRASWELANGPIPVGMQVLHRCDNPPCVRPDHLFLGTHEDNMQDMASKHRGSEGERSPTAKLTDAIVLEAKRRYRTGKSINSMAGEYGIDQSVLNRAVNGKRWKHVPSVLGVIVRDPMNDLDAARERREGLPTLATAAGPGGVDMDVTLDPPPPRRGK